MSPAETIKRIAQVASAIGWQAGVGAMETAGNIVSFLAAHPEHIDDFVEGRTSTIDWPPTWLRDGDLTWLGMDGEIHDPETVRQSIIIRRLEKGSA